MGRHFKSCICPRYNEWWRYWIQITLIGSEFKIWLHHYGIYYVIKRYHITNVGWKKHWLNSDKHFNHLVDLFVIAPWKVESSLVLWNKVLVIYVISYVSHVVKDLFDVPINCIHLFFNTIMLWVELCGCLCLLHLLSYNTCKLQIQINFQDWLHLDLQKFPFFPID